MRRTALLILVLFAALCTGCSTAETTAPINPPPSAEAITDASMSASASTRATATPSSVAAAPAVDAAESSIAPRPKLVVWHSFPPGGREEQTLNSLLDAARQAQPDHDIEALAVPGDKLSSRFEMVTVAGGGPDLMIAPNDHLLRQARAELIRNLNSELAAIRATLAPNAIDSLVVDGKLYGMPLSRSTVALYYNRGTVAGPPPTTQQLIDAAKAGTRVVLIRSIYHNFGFLGAFGGQLFDADGRCIADVGGAAEALAYLRELKAAGARFVTDGSEAEAVFKSGEADITLNGSWLLADFRAALGDQLGVAPLPAGPAGPAKPLVSGTGVFVSANSSNTAQAIALATQLTSAEAQLKWADEAGLLPANPTVPIADPAVGGLAAASLTGIARPQRPELNAFWQPFDAALVEVLDNNADPAAAVQAACTAVNQANGK